MVGMLSLKEKTLFMNFSSLLAIALILITAYGVYEYVRIVPLVRASKELPKTIGETNRDTAATRSLLVLGDSTAVGVGTESKFSVPERVASSIGASVENRARSGARTEELLSQLAAAEHDSYDLILIQAGANDVIFFESLSEAERYMNTLLTQAQKLSDRVVVLTAGRIGDAPLFPYIARPILNIRAANLRKRFSELSKMHSAEYVDLYKLPSPFGSNPEKYYAPDFLHLSAEGYEVWALYVNEAAQARWPELYASQQ